MCTYIYICHIAYKQTCVTFNMYVILHTQHVWYSDMQIIEHWNVGGSTQVPAYE